MSRPPVRPQPKAGRRPPAWHRHAASPHPPTPCCPRRWEGWNACRDTCNRITFPLRHPFAGLSILGGIVSDGMNDKGLSAGVLWIDDSFASYNYRQGREGLPACLLPYDRPQAPTQAADTCPLPLPPPAQRRRPAGAGVPGPGSLPACQLRDRAGGCGFSGPNTSAGAGQAGGAGRRGLASAC